MKSVKWHPLTKINFAILNPHVSFYWHTKPQNLATWKPRMWRDRISKHHYSAVQVGPCYLRIKINSAYKNKQTWNKKIMWYCLKLCKSLKLNVTRISDILPWSFGCSESFMGLFVIFQIFMTRKPNLVILLVPHFTLTDVTRWANRYRIMH